MVSFNPELAFFPMSCVLRGFSPATYVMYAST